MGVMKVEDIKKVMKKYGLAWDSQDTELILDCFTENAIYQESPLAKPYRGHKEIAEFWDTEVKGNQEDIKFKVGKCYVSDDGETGFAEWECINTNLEEDKICHMVGIMILKMEGNKISYLNEYWNTKHLERR